MYEKNEKKWIQISNSHKIFYALIQAIQENNLRLMFFGHLGFGIHENFTYCSLYCNHASLISESLGPHSSAGRRLALNRFQTKNYT